MWQRQYHVDFTSRARRELAKVPPDDRVRLAEAAMGLARDPRPRGVLRLQGSGSLYRIRVGDWRIIYGLSDHTREVTVTQILRRSETTYKDL